MLLSKNRFFWGDGEDGDDCFVQTKIVQNVPGLLPTVVVWNRVNLNKLHKIDYIKSISCHFAVDQLRSFQFRGVELARIPNCNSRFCISYDIH